MLFNSYIFVLVFLPLCMVGYFGLNHAKHYTLAQIFLFAMSLWFYAYFNLNYLGIILASIAINYLFTQLLHRTDNPALRKLECITAIVSNIGILFYYKYFDFFLMNLNRFAHTDFTLHNILLPLGISFFTFQQVSYVIDTYRKEAAPYSFLQYASFVVYFPQLIAGPIVSHDELIPQFMDESKKQFNWDNFGKGLYLFSMGLAKKVLIADLFAGAANWGFSNVQILDTTNAVLASLAYTIQIYFDFSGYCDMAIGIGQMMNLELPVNFDSPYISLSIGEFWHRWHKTLTRFFTRYIYIPLGGNRKGILRTYLNIMIVYTVSGLWHGANYTFIAWGILQGILCVANRHWDKQISRAHPALRWMITFALINLSWTLFRADSIGDFLIFIRKFFWLDLGPVNENLSAAFMIPEIKFIQNTITTLTYQLYEPETFLPFFYCGAIVLALNTKNAYVRMKEFVPTPGRLIFCTLLLSISIMTFGSVSTFLYFNF